jgi:outer membrane immunogenic protein
MRVKILCVGLLASIAGSGSAVAADYDVRAAPASAPPPVPVAAAPAYVPNWVGFYVGILGGGGTAHTSFDQAR